MKHRGNAAILETVDEVNEVFWGPTNWDSRRGGLKCGYYAAYHCLSLPDHIAVNFGVDFATKALSDYWNALDGVEVGFAPFDFYDGDEYTRYEKKTRHQDDLYLKAAKHIASKGVDSFDIQISNGESYRGVKFTNRATGKSFTFKDTVDYCLTTDAINLFREKESATISRELSDDLLDFTTEEES
jgi:hypothetical protein